MGAGGVRMLRRIVLVVLLCVGVAPAEADAPFGVGPIKLGMSAAQVRAALPQAKWQENRDGSIKASGGLRFGDMDFDVSYETRPWDRFTLLLQQESQIGAAECQQRFEAFARAAEAAFSPLQPASFTPAAREGTTLRLSDKSEASYARHDSDLTKDGWTFVAEARAQVGETTLYLTGATRPRRYIAPSEYACFLTLSANVEPPRPPQGEVAFDNLVVTRQISIGVKHQTLSGRELPPAGGVDFTYGCEVRNTSSVANEYELIGCTRTDPGERGSALENVAWARLQALRVAPRGKDGRWTVGERITAHVRVAPEDRQTLPANIAVADQTLLRFDETPRNADVNRFYPTAAIRRGAEGEIVVACVVQVDLSVVCRPVEIVSKPEGSESEMVEAANKMAALYRAAPKLSDGRSSVGVGFRTRFKFKLD